jgi:uncharacterized protein (DUF924 family)
MIIDEDAINKVINFWFKECKPIDWFKKNTSFDLLIKKKFLKLVNLALNNKLSDWENTKEGSLALIILLDQFTRNIFRGNAKSFSGDLDALKITLKCIERKNIEIFDQNSRQFILLPMMHSEDIEIQNKSLPLFKKYTNQKVYEFAIKHRNIISRFGRFPHRNKVLERKPTPEEIEFLKQPGSSF